MSEYFERPFLPGRGEPAPLPLSRHLPELSPGMASTWLRDTIPPGSWVLDPIGSTPALALECARAGYRVLVTCNNPILQFIHETLASAPQAEEFQSALAEVAVLRRGSERLDLYLQSLYKTECSNCGQFIPVEAYLWKRDEDQPFSRIYHCPHCGENGERPVTGKDLDQIENLSGDLLSRARALDRISLEEGFQAGAKEALQVYSARSLHFLFTLLNKTEGISSDMSRRKRLLWALLISAFDAGNKLWPWPSARHHPRQLNVPPQFRENNLWSAMEEAISDWCSNSTPVTLTHWPELSPSEGGICLFRGRLRTLQLPPELHLQATLAVFPRPSQAFWTLSAVWSGWLWGRETVIPLRAALERRRYDWQWHANALDSTLQALKLQSSGNMPVFGILPDLAPGFLTAVMVAAKTSGLDLVGMALNGEQETAQILWQTGLNTNKGSAGSLMDASRQTIRSLLLQYNQPTPYISLHAGALATILPLTEDMKPSQLVDQVQSSISGVFKDVEFLKRYESQAQSYESGLWWLASSNQAGESASTNRSTLVDQVEMEIIRHLEKKPGCTFE